MGTVVPFAITHRLEMPAYIHVERCWPEIDRLSPCEAACPLHMDVPNYVIAIAKGNPKQALAIIRESNPLPSVCGCVCHHPCEEVCNRKVVDSAIAIMWLKRYATDWGNSDKPLPIPVTKDAKVAIVGSGPAGLTAAYDLVRKGYGVSIFEASSLPGGMLTSAIPEFVLPRKIVLADIDYIKALGVRIHTDVTVGKDVTIAGLRQQGYKAVLIATGAQKSVELRIPGFDMPGVMTALPFLGKVKLGLAQRLSGRTWVIGGGGVAMDVARTVVRLGAADVHVACLESRKDMPALPWEIEAAEREGVRVHPSLAPQQFTSKNGVRVAGINFKRVKSTWLDSDGRIRWTLIEGPGGEYSVDADTVITAIGQAPEISDVLGEPLNVSKTGCLLVNKGTLETNVRGIFAAGDVSAAGGTVADSMGAGIRAARSIDQYLSGMLITEVTETRQSITIKPEQVPAYFVRRGRWDMPRLLPKEALRTLSETNLGYKDWQAIEEAGRCLNCRMCANCIFERGQLCFETASRLLGRAGTGYGY